MSRISDCISGCLSGCIHNHRDACRSIAFLACGTFIGVGVGYAVVGSSFAFPFIAFAGSALGGGGACLTNRVIHHLYPSPQAPEAIDLDGNPLPDYRSIEEGKVSINS